MCFGDGRLACCMLMCVCRFVSVVGWSAVLFAVCVGYGYGCCGSVVVQCMRAGIVCERDGVDCVPFV